MTSVFKPKKRYGHALARPGFTLVEILVVILIIVVLATLSVFGISRMRSTAHSARSVANLKQWGSLLISFQQENQHFPPANTTTGDSSTESIRERYGVSAYSGWDAFLAQDLNLDPSNPEGIDESLFFHPGDESPPDPQGRARRTYAMVMGNDAIGRRNTMSLRLINVPLPERTLLLTERPPTGKAWVAFSASGADVTSPAQQTSGQPDLNHGGKFNYLFADGHVESLQPEATIGTGSLSQPKGMWTVTSDD